MMGESLLYDKERLFALNKKQKTLEWDLEKSINWSLSIDLQKPLVALDEDAIFFPGASKEQRLVIAQTMGLIIAACVFEMEETLERFKNICWEKIYEKLPVNPEFIELGETFFAEEKKHSLAFRRYLTKFAEALGIETEDIISLLPIVENTRSEKILSHNLEHGGLAFWWIVTIVEQEFLHIFHTLKPHEGGLEPLYYDLHKKHFEEEARHISFPYLMLELLASRYPSWRRAFHVKTDLAFAQILQTSWGIHSLGRLKKVKAMKKEHPFFEILATAYPLMEGQPPARLLWKLLTKAPYVGSVMNTGNHRHVTRFAEKLGSWHIPLPTYAPDRLDAQ